MTFIDLQPAAERMSDVVRATPDDHMGGPTPCARYTVADLLDHISDLTEAFTDAARKSGLQVEGPPSEGDGSRLAEDWRERMPQQLDTLVRAWREPDALTGMTKAGGIEMPSEIAAIVVLEELVVHGWDLARATGQTYTVEDTALHAVIGFVSQFAGPDQADLRGTAFGEPTSVATDASLLDRAIALTGVGGLTWWCRSPWFGPCSLVTVERARRRCGRRGWVVPCTRVDPSPSVDR